MLSVNPIHSKLKELLDPYTNDEFRAMKIKERCNNDETILMHEHLIDFGCKYHVRIQRDVDSSNCNDIIISIYSSIIGWNDVKFSAIASLKSTFGESIVKELEVQLNDEVHSTSKSEEADDIAGYNVVVQVQSKNPLGQGSDFTSSIQNLCKIRSIILGGRLKDALHQLQGHSSSHIQQEETFKIPIQRLDTSSNPIMMYVTTFGQERVTAVIPIIFQDETDRALAKLFSQQFQQAQQKSSAKNVPVCDYRRSTEPPREILSLLSPHKASNSLEHGHGHKSTTPLDLAGFLTFTFFERHMQSNVDAGNTNHNLVADGAIEIILNFYEFLDYHIKCSKSYVHKRLREKKDVMLKKITNHF